MNKKNISETDCSMYESIKRIFQISGGKKIHITNTYQALNWALS